MTGGGRRGEELQRNAVVVALEEARGDKQLAARILRIGKSTLYRKIQKYGL